MTYNEAARRYVGAAAIPRLLTLPLFFIDIAGIVLPSMRLNGRMMRTVLRYPERFKAQDTWRDPGGRRRRSRSSGGRLARKALQR